jgi:hypothetical protein
LIELVVVACHDIGASLYELDEGAHKHSLHEEWLAQERPYLINGYHRSGYRLPPAAFFHASYCYPDQYPRGLADVAGYWVEAKLFGGVVVFDRGESEKECKSLWIHGGSFNDPFTLYPPTAEQFKELVAFLLADGEDKPPFPLPIHGKRENRPRWDPDVAMAEYHIFRNKHERKIIPLPPQRSCRRDTLSWPEYLDEHFLMEQEVARHHGMPVDEAGIKAARKRLSEVTPSSPCWGKWTAQPQDDAEDTKEGRAS